jgi:hypothetical protein
MSVVPVFFQPPFSVRPKLYILTWLPLVPSVLLDVSDLPLGEPALQTTREVFFTLTKVQLNPDYKLQVGMKVPPVFRIGCRHFAGSGSRLFAESGTNPRFFETKFFFKNQKNPICLLKPLQRTFRLQEKHKSSR